LLPSKLVRVDRLCNKNIKTHRFSLQSRVFLYTLGSDAMVETALTCQEKLRQWIDHLRRLDVARFKESKLLRQNQGTSQSRKPRKKQGSRWHRRGRTGLCPFCGADYDPTSTGKSNLHEFAAAVMQARTLHKIVDVEFVLPGEPPAKP
jgi:hypothetical protein